MIAWYDNIPVLSFLLLRGKCRHCQDTISWQYPVVEAVTALLFVAAAFFSPFDWLILARNWFFIAVFIVIFIMDARWYLILDKVTIPAAAVAIIVNIYLKMSWQNLVLAAIIGTGFFLIQYIVSHGRWIGGGDLRLGFLLGVALGWPFVVAAIFLGYGMGAIIGIILLLSKKKAWQSMVPLGTFLSIAAVIVLLFGEPIVNWYLQFINLR
jgi:prepilin signal peptidase PulO-like enzyme (type II secretory pathway)